MLPDASPIARHSFDLLMELDTEYIQLDCAALHLARDFYPSIDLQSYTARLDDYAERVRELRPGTSAPLRFEAMRTILIEEAGIAGNSDDYYDPENSYLNKVLDRGLGIPISLSIVWIEVGRRLNWPVGGVALPGHFLVRFDDPERFVLADPFNDGQTMSLEDCQSLVRRANGEGLKFDSKMLEPVDTRAILTRCLLNLRAVYLALGDLGRLATTLRRLIAVDRQNGKHLQELADICFRRGDVRGAWSMLAVYLEHSPNAEDGPIVRQSMGRLEAVMRAQN